MSLRGVQLTGEDFHDVLESKGVAISLEEAEKLFDKYITEETLDLDKVYAVVIGANDVDEESALLDQALGDEIESSGLLNRIREEIKADIQLRSLDENTPAVSRSSTGLPRL